MRVDGTSAKCNRWFFKFNGNECSGPMTIEAVVYNNWPSGNPNLLHHRSFEGYCENIPQGRVTVELWVGQCPGYVLGNAYTGWNSVDFSFRSHKMTELDVFIAPYVIMHTVIG